eukprot:CAMPEP_0118965912 /NCGR_PEP_ID=MMETSP1173-20130426/3429_1 /TAXON_ID=1034831 /ORGANISM="Rhizochromulina marina cf, Strain CCMP1243" /LENGTH=592 /DNA_ID=CAMNT_0006914603 /DNA_START=86 /DNA_END=1864 /DNA_ORIENTATION=-
MAEAEAEEVEVGPPGKQQEEDIQDHGAQARGNEGEDADGDTAGKSKKKKKRKKKKKKKQQQQQEEEVEGEQAAEEQGAEQAGGDAEDGSAEDGKGGAASGGSSPVEDQEPSSPTASADAPPPPPLPEPQDPEAAAGDGSALAAPPPAVTSPSSQDEQSVEGFVMVSQGATPAGITQPQAVQDLEELAQPTPSPAGEAAPENSEPPQEEAPAPQVQEATPAKGSSMDVDEEDHAFLSPPPELRGLDRNESSYVMPLEVQDLDPLAQAAVIARQQSWGGEEESEEGGDNEEQDVEDWPGQGEQHVPPFSAMDNDTQRMVLTRLLRIASKLKGLEKAALKELVLQHDRELVRLAATVVEDASFADLVVDRVMTSVVDAVHGDYKAIFEGVTTDHGKQLAQMGIEELGQQHPSSQSLTYGEVDFFSFATILEQAQPRPGQIFVDLGHGTGRAVLSAALLYGHVFSACWGIEVLAPLAAASFSAHDRYSQAVRRREWLYGALSQRCAVRVQHGDILEPQSPEETGFEWTDADLVFANSTCFTDELMRGIAARAERMASGSKIITLTKQLVGPRLKLVAEKQLAMSWGPATAFFHVLE